jgi:hypothetical protein
MICHFGTGFIVKKTGIFVIFKLDKRPKLPRLMSIVFRITDIF